MECAEAVLKKWHVKTIVKKIKSVLSVFADYGEAREHIRQAVINQSPYYMMDTSSLAKLSGNICKNN